MSSNKPSDIDESTIDAFSCFRSNSIVFNIIMEKFLHKNLQFATKPFFSDFFCNNYNI